MPPRLSSAYRELTLHTSDVADIEHACSVETISVILNTSSRGRISDLTAGAYGGARLHYMNGNLPWPSDAKTRIVRVADCRVNVSRTWDWDLPAQECYQDT